MRQLLDLEPVWSKHDFFFLTEETALSSSFAPKWRTHYVGHYAVGQARLKGPAHMLLGALKNAFGSLWIMLKEKPDVVISTGAGAMFFGVLWGRILGARIVMIESFARFDKPSLFTRWTAPLAHVKILQSAALAPFMPDALVFDPLKVVEIPRPPKRSLLFATVGATLPFHRLVKSIEELKLRGDIPEDVFIQVGVGGYQPEGEGIETAETLPFDEVQRLLREADIVVCHGGTGSLITALRQGCRTVVMPRLASLGEHYDDHQADITRAFSNRGLVTWATTTDELAEALKTARERPPRSATTDPQALIDFLHGKLAEWGPGKSRVAAPAKAARVSSKS